MATILSESQQSRKNLGRIRCLKKCIEALNDVKSLPESLCYVPKEVKYLVKRSVTIKLNETQDTNCNKSIKKLEIEANSSIFVSGFEFFNDQGLWGEFLRVCIRYNV